VKREICALSGLSANPWCPLRRREWMADDASDAPCNWHHPSDEGVQTIWPAPYRQWALDRGLTNAPGPIGRRIEGASAQVPNPEYRAPNTDFRITSPPDGATYLIDPTLRREYQALPLRAAAARGRIDWSVAGQAVGSADADATVHWTLAPGHHRIVARDARGRTAETTVIVR
jgi:penicillin-binding protein 1C